MLDSNCGCVKGEGGLTVQGLQALSSAELPSHHMRLVMWYLALSFDSEICTRTTICNRVFLWSWFTCELHYLSILCSLLSQLAVSNFSVVRKPKWLKARSMKQCLRWHGGKTYELLIVDWSILHPWKSSFFSCPGQLNRWPCHSLTHSLTHWLTHWLPFSKLDWRDPGVWRCQLKTCWGC